MPTVVAAVSSGANVSVDETHVWLFQIIDLADLRLNVHAVACANGKSFHSERMKLRRLLKAIRAAVVASDDTDNDDVDVISPAGPIDENHVFLLQVIELAGNKPNLKMVAHVNGTKVGVERARLRHLKVDVDDALA